MEALKLIPQVFFDLIARVVPGCVGIVSYLVLSGKNWETTITYLFGQQLAQESTGLSFLIFLGAGYVIGELISPVSKKIQRIGETKFRYSIRKIRISYIRLHVSYILKRELRNRYRSIQKTKGSKKFSEKKIMYDRLRLLHPEVGALCAKIRAEFTMHNSLSAIFTLTALFYPFSVLPFHWYIMSLLLLLIFTTAYRGSTTNKTFNETVKKFTQVLNEKKSDKANKSLSPANVEETIPLQMTPKMGQSECGHL